MTTPSCPEQSQTPVAFDVRHPEDDLKGWGYLARTSFQPAACVHGAEQANLLAIEVSDQSRQQRASFAVDFDNGNLYNGIDVAGFSREDLRQPAGTLRKPDAVLSAAALAELRETLDRYQVFQWPFREPGKPLTNGEYTVKDGYQLAVLFYDDTASFSERPERSDADMIGFLNWSEGFLAEHAK